MKAGSYGKRQKNRGRERLKVKTSPPGDDMEGKTKNKTFPHKAKMEGNTEKQSFPHGKAEGGEH